LPRAAAALQAEVVQAAAARGKHVFCEKPLALSAGQARAMLATARETHVAHAVDFEFAELPSWQEARRLCATGALGRLRHVAVSWRVETLAYRQPKESWKLSAVEGGGTLNLFVSHCLYYLEWLLASRIERVAARLEPAGAAADARVDAWLELSDATPITLAVAADAFCGSGHSIEVYGEQGTLILENRSADYIKGFTLSLATRSSPTLTALAGGGDLPDGDGRVAAVGRLVGRFLDAVLDPEQRAHFQPDLAAGHRVQILMDAIRAAHRSAKWQSLEHHS
jgi:predicted dehydrogenase